MRNELFMPWTDFLSTDTVPQAEIRRPIKFLAEKNGFSTVVAHDDLDQFEGQFFVLDDGTRFGLMSYCKNKPDSTLIFLPRSIADFETIQMLIAKILTELGVPLEEAAGPYRSVGN